MKGADERSTKGNASAAGGGPEVAHRADMRGNKDTLAPGRMK